MLEKSDFNRILEIIDTAASEMEHDGYQEYYLWSVTWDDDESFWVVRFYMEESNLETTGVIVKNRQGTYCATGRMYE